MSSDTVVTVHQGCEDLVQWKLVIRSCVYGSQQSDGRRREAPEAVSRGRVREGGSPSTSVPKRWFGGTTPEKILNFISKMVHFRAFGGKLSNAIEMADTAV